MYLQEAFDKVWNWFVVEKHPQSIGVDNDCQYSTVDAAGNETRCALGCLAPTKEEAQRWDSHSLMEFQVANLLGLKLTRKNMAAAWRKFDQNISNDGVVKNYAFVDLRECHDNARNGSGFSHDIHARLKVYAANYGLTVPA